MCLALQRRAVLPLTVFCASHTLLTVRVAVTCALVFGRGVLQPSRYDCALPPPAYLPLWGVSTTVPRLLHCRSFQVRHHRVFWYLLCALLTLCPHTTVVCAHGFMPYVVALHTWLGDSLRLASLGRASVLSSPFACPLFLWCAFESHTFGVHLAPWTHRLYNTSELASAGLQNTA